MDSLNKHSEDIYKCTKCGLCQSVCPIYEQTGVECAVSRGKFQVLKGIVKGDLEFSKNVSNYLDLCLNCNACTDFCPSGIDAEKIILDARQESFKRGHVPLIKRFLSGLFSSKISLNIIKILIFLYRLLKLNVVTNLLAPLFGSMADKIKLFNSTIDSKKQVNKMSINTKALKIIYFPGCINNYINPSSKNAIKELFKDTNIELVIPGFSCCGIPAENIGDIDTFKKMAKKNLDLIPDEFDYLITDCASCATVWKKYEEILDDDYEQRAKRIADKAMDISELLNSSYIKTTSQHRNETKKLKVTYHDPCHLKRSMGVYKEPRDILKQLPNVEFIEMKDADKCCGAAGMFCISQPEISKAISKEKANNIIDSGADVVITLCPSCEIGLKHGLLEQKSGIRVMSLAELLNNI